MPNYYTDKWITIVDLRTNAARGVMRVRRHAMDSDEDFKEKCWQVVRDWLRHDDSIEHYTWYAS